MVATRFAAALAIALAVVAPALAQNRPTVFGGFGGRPQAPPGIPGWNVPRLYPNIGGALGGGGCGFGPIAPVNFTVINYPPPFYSPPLIVAPPVEPIELGPPPVDPRGGPQMGGQAAGRFRPVGPQDRDRARQPVAPPIQAAPELPAIESGRLVREGKQAFGDGEYGRATELFQRAARVTPNLAEPDLLLAQAQIALGKYAAAAAAIHRGVRRDPAWPANGPPMADLYGARKADFEDHRRRLDEIAAASPDDLAVQFVRAYFAWFDGRRDAARAALTALRGVVADQPTIDLFLNVP